MGRALVPPLLEAGFEVTCVTRTTNKSALPAGAIVKTADYTDIAALTAAFEGLDAVVEAFNPAAASHQASILQAVVAAGVRHIVTPDFGGNTFHPNAAEGLIFDSKLDALRKIERVVAESAGKLSWTAIITGPWFDWTIERGIFWINKDKRTITRHGSGDQKYSMSRLGINSEALVAVLSDPEKYRNRPAYFASHTVSTNQLIAVVEELGQEGWAVVDASIEGLAEKARAMWHEDTENGVEDRLHSKAYEAMATAVLLDENNYYGSNFGDKVEPGWDEGEEALKESLKRVLG